MLLKYINSNRLSVIILISLLPAAIWLLSLFRETGLQGTDVSGILLGKYVLLFSRNYRLLTSFIALFLLFANGYMLVQLNTIYIFISARTQLPLLFYLLLIVSANRLDYLSPALISSTLIIFSFFRVFNTSKSETISMNFLDAGLLISLAGFFYLPALSFALYVWTAIFILRPKNWREPLFVLIGLLLPYIFLLSVFYLSDLSLKEYLNEMLIGMRRIDLPVTIYSIIAWCYAGVLLLTGSYFMVNSIGTMKIQSRKFFYIFLGFFIISVLLYAIFPADVTGMVYFAAAPLAFLFANYFYKCKRTWLNEILLVLFLVLIIFQVII